MSKLRYLPLLFSVTVGMFRVAPIDFVDKVSRKLERKFPWRISLLTLQDRRIQGGNELLYYGELTQFVDQESKRKGKGNPFRSALSGLANEVWSLTAPIYESSYTGILDDDPRVLMFLTNSLPFTCLLYTSPSPRD